MSEGFVKGVHDSDRHGQGQVLGPPVFVGGRYYSDTLDLPQNAQCAPVAAELAGAGGSGLIRVGALWRFLSLAPSPRRNA